MFYDTKTKAQKPKDKPYKYTGDGKGNGGLYLLITPSGGKLWRQNYTYEGKHKTISHGSYPEISILEAQGKRDEVKMMLRQGIDPMAAKKENRQEALRNTNTFRMLAENWVARNAKNWSEGTLICYRSALEKKIYPEFGDTPLIQMEGQRGKIVEFIRRLEKNGETTAKKVQMLMHQIFRDAVQADLCKANPMAELSGMVTRPPVRHQPAITDPREVGKLLLDLDNAKGSPSIAYALRVLPRVFVRPSELCEATWNEINMETATWTIPAGRMKMKRPHVVPLSQQVIELLREVKALYPDSNYLFPSPRAAGKPITTEGLWQALEAKGYKGRQSPHGFRGTASTLLYGQLRKSPHVIEAQLAHVQGNRTTAAYNHADYLEERREMMQRYADYLDELKEKAREEEEKEQSK